MENKNDAERAKYGRFITEKETSMDELKQDQKKIEMSLLDLQEELHRGYRTLAMLNEEVVHEGNIEGIRMQRRNEEQEVFFAHQLREAEENLSNFYSEQRKILDKETEELYKKRGEIPWD
ncbi:hypothetical protein [Enterococcus wangshanyuanii]|uniref:Cingulin n=1 Tax=Enterococcus wangshanyuanii TaxID=2005703 RepID=A0ABQ1PUA2_9ENTE|nr:hypothetical protein [Enterococcus wangshanyuanii]GGD03816.1 hypothetical protein GCM10011573_36630 [Enterococcus wangshanyuanii]